jgi:DNA mismatch endonuclease (patch repair protein)
MADVHDKATRSRNMRQIKAKNTRPEMIVRKFLHARGFRYLLHDKRLPGKPDLVLPRYHTVIFVHGCYWHKHADCPYFIVPATNTQRWMAKINGNVTRDQKVTQLLEDIGWRILIVWECELKKNKLTATLTKLAGDIKAG